MEKRRGLLSQSGFGMFGLLELLVVLLMVAVFLFLTIGQRTQSMGLRDKAARKEMAQAGMNVATHETTVSSVNAKLKGVQAQLADRKNRMLETS